MESTKLYERACAVIPGGVNSPVRAFKQVGCEPLFVLRAKGSSIIDHQEETYLDFIGAWGPMLFGHADNALVKATRQAASRSHSFGLASILEVELAERILEKLKFKGQIRFVNSGTEAAMTAVRLARGYTGCDIIAKFSGCYHGAVDSLLVEAGSGVATFAFAEKPSSKGIPENVIKDTVILPYNNIEAVEQFFEEHGRKCAAIMVEPVAGNMGVIPGEKDFLERLRDLSADYGVALVFDEVMSGFRVAERGAMGFYDITPDILLLGKVLGGGMPFAAIAGKEDIMECLSPVGDVYHAGTMNGNPVAANTAMAVLDRIDEWKHYETEESTYVYLDAIGKQIDEGLKPALEKHQDKICFQRMGSMATLFFKKGPVKNFDDAKAAADTGLYTKFFQGMFEKKIIMPPSPYEAFFFSAAHSKDDIENFVTAASEVLDSILA